MVIASERTAVGLSRNSAENASAPCRPIYHACRDEADRITIAVSLGAAGSRYLSSGASDSAAGIAYRVLFSLAPLIVSLGLLPEPGVADRRHRQARVGATREERGRRGRVLPNLHLKTNNIWVKGWPWHTTVFVQWDGTATLLDGDALYFNRGLQVITLRWGKVCALDVFEDSQEVARGLAAQAAAGLEEAVAEQIVSSFDLTLGALRTIGFSDKRTLNRRSD